MSLAALKARVEPGWTVKVTNHDYIKDSGVRIVTRNSELDLMSVDKKGRAHSLLWPTADSDYEVEGNTLKIYKKYHAYTGGRAIILTLVFSDAVTG